MATAARLSASRLAASRIWPACVQASAISCSWLAITQSDPRAAAIRWAGSRLASSSQSPPAVTDLGAPRVPAAPQRWAEVAVGGRRHGVGDACRECRNLFGR